MIQNITYLKKINTFILIKEKSRNIEWGEEKQRFNKARMFSPFIKLRLLLSKFNKISSNKEFD